MNYPINFHQTFAPEVDALAQIVRVASPEMEFLSKEETSSLTSITTGASSGKVVPNLYYAQAMGLIDLEKDGTNYKFKLTDLGEVLKYEDPYFIEDITKLICHINLVSLTSPAALWSFVFNKFIPQVPSPFTTEQLEKVAARYLEEKTVKLLPFRSTYNGNHSLKSIAPLVIEEDVFNVSPLPVLGDYRFVYSYALFNMWEELLGNESEITIDQLQNQLGFGKQFIWSEKQVYEALELIKEEGLIEINAQLSPITVIKKSSKNNVLDKLYSLLL